MFLDIKPQIFSAFNYEPTESCEMTMVKMNKMQVYLANMHIFQLEKQELTFLLLIKKQVTFSWK